MKLIIAITEDAHAPKLLERLVELGIGATKLASTGGFMRQGNTTFMIGTEEAHIQTVVDAVKSETSGSILFVVDVERFEKE